MALAAAPFTFVMMSFVYAFQLAAQALFPDSTSAHPVAEGLLSGPSLWLQIVLGLLAVVYAPIFEELFFRAFLYSTLKRIAPQSLAILVQAVVFSLVHGLGWAQSIGYIVIGLGLAHLYDRRRTILAPIFAHAYINLFAVVVTIGLSALMANAPMLGILGEDADEGIAVVEVMYDSAAATAGIRAGDRIVRVDEYEVD